MRECEIEKEQSKKYRDDYMIAILKAEEKLAIIDYEIAVKKWETLEEKEKK